MSRWTVPVEKFIEQSAEQSYFFCTGFFKDVDRVKVSTLGSEHQRGPSNVVFSVDVGTGFDKGTHDF